MVKKALNGKLIVVEGGDGSGKTKQVELLTRRLLALGYPVRVWDFPQYGSSYYGRMVGRMLKGEFGELMRIHPTLAAMVFANDRLSVRDEMIDHLRVGGIGLCNRYVDSNLAHGGAKFGDRVDALAYIEDIEALEFGENGLPVPDASFYLATDAELSCRLVLAKGERLYMGEEVETDQAERDLVHQIRTREMYEHLCASRERFLRVECMKTPGEIESIEEIHERVWAALCSRFVV